MHTLCAQLSWSHYCLLIKLKNKEERLFYEDQTILNSWSTRELEKKIKSKEFKNKRDKHNKTVLLEYFSGPLTIFKEEYNWNFLQLDKEHNEKQLEEALLNNIPKILLEFGNGFSFIGKQQKLIISGQWHKVDLLFYHRFLKCIIVVELKTEKFKPEFVGQVNKYLTYFRENKLQHENDPIGLIICKEKDSEEVHYALGRLKEEIFVAKYRLYLPKEEDIKKRLR
ncbi:DUF1016 family protein [Candidatus Woesearchaeota archaeon]|nr:DUF1016 family protein [Candidatus Woesearchaeota archaeon]